MHVLVIDQCSNSKSYPDESAVFDAAAIDEHGLEELLSREDAVGIPARKLYGGRQQKYVNEAVDAFRANGHSVDRYFISAGFGLVEETDPIPPYDVTFADMNAAEIEVRAEKMEISGDIDRLLETTSYDVVFFPLGKDYYRSINLPELLSALPSDALGVIFNQDTVAVDYDNVLSLSAGLDEAKEQGTIVVALKGVYLKNVADHVQNGMTLETLEDIEMACTSEPTEQRGLSDF